MVRCGKLIVAIDESEVGDLKALAQRCQENQVAIERLDAAEIKRRESHIRDVAGFLVSSTEITNDVAVTPHATANLRSRWRSPA